MGMSRDTDLSRALPVPASRLARLGRLGRMTAGVAGNMALGGIAQLGQGQRPKARDLLLTPRNISRVAEQLAQMRGAAMKIGQLMSMDSGDLLPPELAQIMARLRDDAHFMPPAQLKGVLAEAWPKGWLDAFRHFDVRPMAAASIGQVHRAQLKDGRDLAIKIQYPGVAQSIDSDVANVGALIRMSGLLPNGLDLASYLEEGRKQLHEETDYRREAGQLTRFRALLAGDARFVVPELHPDWSTGSILAMTYVTGTPVEQAVSEPQETRNRIATTLIDLTLRELFAFGAMQTDPNFANYLYRPDTGQIILLDFGAARDISPEVCDQYRRLIRAGLAGEAATIARTLQDMGFFGPDTRPDHAERILRMIAMVFAALKQAPQLTFPQRALAQALQAEGLALAEDGFVPPPLPLDLLLVQRKLGGIFLLAERLGATGAVLGLLGNPLAPPPPD